MDLTKIDLQQAAHATRSDGRRMPEGSGVGARLTRQMMSPRSGCQCKLGGNELVELLSCAMEAAYGPEHAPTPADAPEDCAVLAVVDASALLVTTDLGPIVGVDLVAAGRIAALHAMSDIFASGGSPRWALVTLVLDPNHPDTVGEAVLAGILRTCVDEHVDVVGGQTIVGPEAMAGLTVIGMPPSRGVLRKRGASPGDVLLVSKPLGVGLVVRAYKLGLVGDGALAEAVAVMTTSNRQASSAAIDARCNASTDVTGFGLLGHLAEMLGGNHGAILNTDTIPVLEAASVLPQEVGRTHWIDSNRAYVSRLRRLVADCDATRLTPLLDPQTNGGLLVAVDPARVPALTWQGFTAIGRIVEGNTIHVQ